jgi:hypothetical protein
MGLVGAAQTIHLELVKEKRRRRMYARECLEVALAIAGREDREKVRICELRRRAEEEHGPELTAKRLKAEAVASTATLRMRKKSLRISKTLLKKYAMKTLTPDRLGDGAKCKPALTKAKKARSDVLDRLAQLGVGLSPEQRNDFGWFKTSWGAKMLEHYGSEWPNTFAGWVQQVLDELGQEGGSNAFSVFVHNETMRCFCEQPALRLPGGSKV